MQITIFAKKATTKEGKNFTRYISRLTKKSGEEVTVTVKFREECGSPSAEDCPLNILVENGDCNLSTRWYDSTDSNGEVVRRESHTLWVSDWMRDTANPYEDHSMDEFC